MLPEKFNVRVYGILLHEDKLLINEELIRGNVIIKFPGGGLDLGEGTREGLAREWKEELNLDIDVLEHFYTTDFYQHSAFDNSQVMSIYYWVRAKDFPEQIVNYVENERTFWLDIHELDEHVFTLPIDKRVGKMLADLLQKHQ
jgi:8-oxo-dGTP pyrophosphatase MutT (NUDIX family)